MIAFLRDVSPEINGCALTYQARELIAVGRARQQHESYAATLRELGARVEFIAAAPALPDGVFVEDTAVVLPEVAIIARPGATSRSAEIETVFSALARHRPLRVIKEPGQVEGGDVLRVGRRLYVGRSLRTNDDGIAQLADLAMEFDYEVRRVDVRGCLHLKTACTFVPPHFVVLNPAWIAQEAFASFTVISVDDREPGGANTLTLAGTTLVSASYPKTQRRLAEIGLSTRHVDISELEKAEAGLTCLSLIME